MHPPHIVIFEPDADGHQMGHVRRILGALQRQVPQARVTLLTSEAGAEHPSCRMVAADFAGLLAVRVAPAPPRASRFVRAMGAYRTYRWANARRLTAGLRQLGPETVDFVLITHMECIGLLDLALSPRLTCGRPWGILSVSMSFHLRQAGLRVPFRWADMVHRLLFHAVIRHPGLTIFGTNDRWLMPTLRYKKIAYCPDPSEPPWSNDRDSARRAYGIRPDTCMVLVFGFLDGRKCIDVLLEGAARLPPEVDVTILLAGHQHRRQVASALEGEAARTLRERGRLLEVNRFLILTPGGDPDPMCAADIVWVFYQPQFVFISGVLGQAAQAGLPVICRATGVIGRLVEEIGFGLALSSETPDEIAAALTRLARDPALRAKMGGKGREGFAGNTPEAFADPIAAGIARTLGVAGAAPPGMGGVH